MDPTENTASIVETCLPSHCIATVAAQTHRKQSLYCWGFFTEPLLSSALAIRVTITCFNVSLSCHCPALWGSCYINKYKHYCSGCSSYLRTMMIFYIFLLLLVGWVTGGWRKLHNEELHSLYSSPSIIRMIKSRGMRWAGHVARMEKRNAYRILVGKPEGNRPLG
jgi:hypothetical protein